MLLGRFSSEWYRFMNYRCTLYAKNCKLLNFQKVLELCVLFQSLTSSCQSYFRGLDVPKYKQNPHRLADLCAVTISFQPSLTAHDMAENTLISQFKSRKFARAQRRQYTIDSTNLSLHVWRSVGFNQCWLMFRTSNKKEREDEASTRDMAQWRLTKKTFFFQEIIPSTTFRHQTTSYRCRRFECIPRIKRERESLIWAANFHQHQHHHEVKSKFYRAAVWLVESCMDDGEKHLFH